MLKATVPASTTTPNKFSIVLGADIRLRQPVSIAINTMNNNTNATSIRPFFISQTV